MRFTAFLLGAVLAASLLPAATAAQQSRLLTVTGEGAVTAVPDMATVQIGVEAQAATAQEAMSAVSDRTQALIDRLDALGIAARDRQTAGLSLRLVYPDRRNVDEPPRIVAFNASNSLSVRVRDLDQLGAALAALLSDGANTLSNLSFDLSEPRPMLDEARRLAVADALSKAELYAEAAGVTLGAVQSISEGGRAAPPPMRMMAMEVAMDALPIAAGETSVTAQVTVVYAIGD